MKHRLVPWSSRLIVLIAVFVVSAIHAIVADHAQRTSLRDARVVVFDIGQGDAILLDGPGEDAEVLIDGGPDGRAVVRALETHLGRDRSINLIVLTHPHADHVAGLVDVLAQYDVGRILLTGVVHTTSEYRRFLDAVQARGITTTIAAADQSYAIGPFHLEVLFPLTSIAGTRVENLNSSSVVMMMAVDAPVPPPGVDATAYRLLFTGDAEADVEGALLERGVDLHADVLKVPHHGSQDSSSDAFLAAVSPAHAIIPVGRRNRFGHPHRRTLKRIERSGATIWRTDTQGDITITFGEDLSITSER